LVPRLSAPRRRLVSPPGLILLAAGVALHAWHVDPDQQSDALKRRRPDPRVNPSQR